jgi:hypothetical protein
MKGYVIPVSQKSLQIKGWVVKAWRPPIPSLSLIDKRPILKKSLLLGNAARDPAFPAFIKKCSALKRLAMRLRIKPR